MSDSNEEILYITDPHPDIENNIKRKPFEYYVRHPASGINEDTGLIFCICGYGSAPESSYEKDTLRPYLADKYNCLTIGVNYFGCHIKYHYTRMVIHEFFDRLRQHHNVTGIDNPDQLEGYELFCSLCPSLLSNGIKRLHPECLVGAYSPGEYTNFGLLPAIDHLHVLGEIFKKYKINKDRVYALGTSYGGYIVLMMAMMAPQTFSLIVENSGFSLTETDIFGHNNKQLLANWVTINGVEVLQTEIGLWSQDPESPHYFAPHNEQIRNLLIEEHWNPIRTCFYGYHCEADKLASVKNKIHLYQMLKKKTRAHLLVINEDNIDGRLFRSLDHGANASDRGLFDLSYEKHLSAESTQQGVPNDFDRQSCYSFFCGQKVYQCTYFKDGLRLTLASS
ncbi:MAG: DUF2920 family protein [Deltaproteobacteria bacterium]|nr:DUF2920 family protein [Deltaproteobacteria bacterium]